MKKIYALSVLVLIFSLLLLGCASGPGEKLAQYNFKQGTPELELKFLKNAPPEKIYPNSEFKIIVEADSLAAYDIKNGVIKIIGLDEKYFLVNPLEQNLEPLKGKSMISPTGEKQFLEFSGLARELLPGAQEYQGNFFLKAKYNSKMEFADTICINSNLYTVYDSGCTVEDHKSYDGQGAPLAVTEMDEILYPGGGANVEFRFKLNNRGKGKIYSITYGSARLGGEEIPCQFQGALFDPKHISLTEDKQEALLICRQFLPSQNSYTTTLSLDFTYDYELKEQHQLKLVNPTAEKSSIFGRT